MAEKPERPDRNAVIMRARELRRRLSLPEALLWRELRKRPGGYKFRKQHPLGWYIVDFYCAATRLVIEIDGESHSMGTRPENDASRDSWIEKQGMRLIRFPASNVMKDLESVITAILIECRH